MTKAMKKCAGLLLLLVLALTALLLPACSGEQQQPPFSEDAGAFTLYSKEAASDLYLDEGDHPQVLRAAGDLKEDIARVSGGEVRVRTETPTSGRAVIIGTLGKSALIDSLVESGKLNEASAIAGKWESYVVKIVEQPMQGVERALVVAGSDKRGTIYGIYTVSENIGVSPWHFFADVTPQKGERAVYTGTTLVSKEPSVKYRGIFINDEFNFTSWAKMFSNGMGAPNAEVYGYVFELLLRLKANTLWPGMHGVSTAFYRDRGEDGVSLNAREADRYGVVIGTSHCEQCLRNNVGEWQDWVKANSGKYGLPDVSSYTRYPQFSALYDYSLYPRALEAYWYERLEEAKDFESLITIGMRGVHDESFSYAGLEDKSFPSRVALLQSVIDKQLEMIREIYGENYEEKIQLVYIPYKEAADYYYGTEGGVDYGVRVKIPESTMLMWADDNYGYVRQTPDREDVIFKNGYGNQGIYYHISYVGVPCVYIWTDLTEYATIHEEMRRAYDTGANGYWIVNVGDIKPGEYGMEFFLQLAYDVDGYDYANGGYRAYAKQRALRDFTKDEALATEIADLSVSFKAAADNYRSDYAGKDNMPALSHVSGGDEAMALVEQFAGFYARGEAVMQALPAEKRDAFFEMVHYAIRAQYFSIQRTVYAQRTQLCFRQGRYLAAAEYGAAAIAAQDALEADVLYFNNTLADGKWYGITNEHIGGDYYGTITREELERMIIPVSATMGVDGVGAVCEGQTVYAEGGELVFTDLGREERFLDVYTLGAGACDYTLEKPAWLVASYEGNVASEERVVLTVDWAQVPNGATGEVVVRDAFGHSYTFAVRAEAVGIAPDRDSYIMLDGVASVEAERYTDIRAGEGDTCWKQVAELGRSGDSMRVYPDTAPRTQDVANAARLTYTVYVPRAAGYTVTLYRVPTLNESGSMQVGVSVGDGSVQTVSGTYRTGQGSWGANVMPRIEKVVFTLALQAGYNDIHFYRLDPFFAFDKFVITAPGKTDESYFGADETYNTMHYEGSKVAQLPAIERGQIAQELEHARYLFNFGMGSELNSYYTHVSVANGVYDEYKGFGFATAKQAEGVTSYERDGSVSQRNATFVQGSGNAQWLVDVPNGRYSVAVVCGDFDKNGLTANMSVSANGVPVLQNASVAAGGVGEYFAVVTVTEGRMTFDLSGTWILNAIEIYPYTPTQESGSGEFIVTRNGGYIEAESALENSQYARVEAATSNRRAWTETAGVSGSAMVVGPDAGYSNTNTSTPTGAALHYKVRFEQSGTYYLWALVKTVSADDDSFHVGWDGTYRGSFNPSKRQEGFVWIYSRFSVSVRAGETHTLTIWQREDGIVIDKLYLSPFYSSVSAGLPAGDQFPVNDGQEIRAIPPAAGKAQDE